MTSEQIKSLMREIQIIKEAGLEGEAYFLSKRLEEKIVVNVERVRRIEQFRKAKKHGHADFIIEIANKGRGGVFLPKEEWRNVTGWEGLYMVSNRGAVKRLGRYVSAGGRCKDPDMKRFLPERGLLLSVDAVGYFKADMKDGSRRENALVHRLAALAFIPAAEGRPFINHINGIKTDNRIENLEWCTQLENMQHAYQGGLLKSFIPLRGDDSPNSKLNSNQVIDIIDRLNSRQSCSSIAKIYGVSDGTINFIARGKTWKGLQHLNKCWLAMATPDDAA